MPFLDELADRLVAQGIGVLSANIIKGSKGIVPKGDGPYISLIETGGAGPTRVHNLASANTQRPTAQVLVRARSYSVARLKAKDVYEVLDGIFNTTLSGTFYQSIVARQEPEDIGLDAEARPMIVFNVEAERSPASGVWTDDGWVQ
mgnify:CR=1 FL=1